MCPAVIPRKQINILTLMFERFLLFKHQTPGTQGMHLSHAQILERVQTKKEYDTACSRVIADLSTVAA